MSGKIAFSEKALEQINSGKQSHALTSVKAGWTWFLLGSVTLFFAVVIFWGFYGSMVDSISGVGITLLRGGTRPVIARGTGTLSHLNIKAGSIVSSDQIVGQIYSPEMLFNVRKEESEYRLLQAEVDFLKQGMEELTARQIKSEKIKEKHLAQLTGQHEKSRDRAKDLVKMYSNLKSTGAASKVSYYQILDQQLQSEGSFVSTMFQSIDNNVAQENHKWELAEKILQLKRKLEQKEKDLAVAQKLYKESYWITPNFDGQVIEVFKEDGAFVRTGDRIALVGSKADSDMYLLAFVPTKDGKKIRNGMTAFFSVAAADSAKYGYLKCVVRDVSEMPVNPETIQAELMNDSITKMVAGQAAVIRVVLEMLPDAESPSGFKWTSKKGYPRKIVNGMMGEVIINTDYRAPASYIIPAVRELMMRKKTKEKPEK